MACTYNFEKRATRSHFTECAAPNICTTYGKIVYTVHLPYSCGCNGEYAKMRLFDFHVASFGRVFYGFFSGYENLFGISHSKWKRFNLTMAIYYTLSI